MARPVAELSLNDNGVRSALKHVSDYEDEYETFTELNFQFVMFVHLLHKPSDSD